MNDVHDGLGVKNISDLVSKEIHGIYGTKNSTKKQIRKYKSSEKELNKECNSNCKYAHSDLMARIVKNCRGEKKRSKKKIDEFRIRLGFRPNDKIMTKEESITTKIMKVFAKENIKLGHSLLDYYIDLCFPKYRLAVEIDEKDYSDR